MNAKVHISVPRDLDEDELLDLFRERIDELQPALDLELEDDRANVDEIEILSVTRNESGVEIEYAIQFSAYYGCRDQNYANEDQRSLTGIWQGDGYSFDAFVPPPRRDTVDEF